ncbi:MAG TPA: 50S ribosomal protein L4 [Gaiellaceae bacterium]|jgi:large subunit ribosomal protein L4|nr:50S ribosomal protein L4 [Gaiellaceae bacterium]
MAAPKAPLLAADGKKTRDVTLDAAVFTAAVKPHLIHEAVRAEAAAARAGTQATKSRGLVSGGRSKPWRQKGTGRARAGTTRSPHWTGGGHAFALRPRSHEVKVNRKARKGALRGALAAHASRGSLALVDASAFGDEPSTREAAGLLDSWGGERPLLVVAQPDERTVIRSFRNLDRVLVLEPAELEVGALVWARSLLTTEAALARLQEVAS